MRYPHPSVCGPHTPLSPSTKLVTPEGKCWYSGLVNSKARTFIQIYLFTTEAGGIQILSWILLPQCSLWSTNGLNSTRLSSSQWIRLNESGQKPFLTQEQFTLSKGIKILIKEPVSCIITSSVASARKCQPPPCYLTSVQWSGKHAQVHLASFVWIWTRSKLLYILLGLVLLMGR